MTAPALEHTYAALPAAFHAPVRLQPAPEPRLLALNAPLATFLGLDPDWLATPDGLAMLTASRMPDGMSPVAMAYSRFDEETREEAHAEYLDSISGFWTEEGYRIPGEFVVARGTKGAT